jgi:hypothetical protein
MPDYERACAQFSWAAAAGDLAGLPQGGLNIAYEAVDRHVDGPLSDAVAFRFPPQATRSDRTDGARAGSGQRLLQLASRVRAGAQSVIRAP